MTKPGITALLTSAAVLAVGRLFGLPELYVVGAAGLTIVAVSIAYVSLRRLNVEVMRTVAPVRVHAGSPCRVDLQLENRSLVKAPVMRLRDEVSGTRGVELLIAPLGSDEVTNAGYRLPTDRRGIIRIGPLSLTVTDPFGLARLTTTEDREMSLVVYPKIERIPSVRRTSGSDMERHRLAQHQVAPLGDEFYALRQYVVGDDLRRVHWPSSARHDDLMVRQDEIPWHGHLTVLLDTRQGVDVDTFERMVSAAASLAAAAVRAGDQVRLVTTGGQETPFASGPHHLDRMLEMLALVEPGTQLSTSSIERLTTMDSGGTVAGITANTREVDHGLVHAASMSYRSRFLIMFADQDATPAGAGRQVGSTTVVVVGARQSFADAWVRSGARTARIAR